MKNDEPLSHQKARVSEARFAKKWFDTVNTMRLSGWPKKWRLSFVERAISHGISVSFSTFPPVQFLPNSHSVNKNLEKVTAQVKSYMDFGAVIERPLGWSPRFGTQPLIAVPKAGSSELRLVIDLSRNLNGFTTVPPFSYSSVQKAVNLCSKDCWLFKIDLRNAYLSFPVSDKLRDSLTFGLNGRYYQFRALPFGLAVAPFYCTCLLEVVEFELRSVLGCSVTSYLDDFLFICPDEESAHIALAASMKIFYDFGLVVNTNKTCFPSQNITFLGIQIDSTTQTLSCPAGRLVELSSLLSQAADWSSCSTHQLESLIGKLSFAAQVLPGARPFLRSLIDLLSASKALEKRSRTITISAEVSHDLSHWLAFLSFWNGRMLWRRDDNDPFVIISDASLSGFAFYIHSFPNEFIPAMIPEWAMTTAAFAGRYSPEHAHWHNDHTNIAVCELLAVVGAAMIYGNLFSNHTVIFELDNLVDVEVINRQSSRAPLVNKLLKVLFDLSFQFNFSFYARHRPGSQNIRADFLSRAELHLNNHSASWALAHPSLVPFSMVSLTCSRNCVPASFKL